MPSAAWASADSGASLSGVLQIRLRVGEQAALAEDDPAQDEHVGVLRAARGAARRASRTPAPSRRATPARARACSGRRSRVGRILSRCACSRSPPSSCAAATREPSADDRESAPLSHDPPSASMIIATAGPSTTANSEGRMHMMSGIGHLDRRPSPPSPRPAACAWCACPPRGRASARDTLVPNISVWMIIADSVRRSSTPVRFDRRWNASERRTPAWISSSVCFISCARTGDDQLHLLRDARHRGVQRQAGLDAGHQQVHRVGQRLRDQLLPRLDLAAQPEVGKEERERDADERDGDRRRQLERRLAGASRSATG